MVHNRFAAGSILGLRFFRRPVSWIAASFLFCGFASAAVPSITSLSATPRYPWNGLVDVDVSFTGNTGDVFRIEFSAMDAAGGTNLPMTAVSEAMPDHEVPYLLSTGGTRIATSFVPPVDGIVETKVRFSNLSKNATVFCARGETTADRTFSLFRIGSSGFRFDCGSNGSAAGFLATDVDYTIRASAADGFTVDGREIRAPVSAMTGSVGGPISLFSSYYGGVENHVDNFLVGRMYYFRVRSAAGALLLDLVPWRRNGVLGFRDRVSGTFFPPSEGAFADIDRVRPGTYRFVWDAAADLGEEFLSDRVSVSAELFNPIWDFDSIPAVDPNDVWAPETVYHDIQTVVSYGEIEDPTPAVRCLNDEWDLDAKLGPNTLVSGASMLVRSPTDGNITRLGITNAIAVLAMSDTTNVFRIVTLDYETGKLGYDVASPTLSTTAEGHFFAFKNQGRVYLDMYRGTNGYNAFVKSVNTDASSTFFENRHDGLYYGSAVCGYFPHGIPFSNASKTTYPSTYDKNTCGAVFHAGVSGTDIKQTIVQITEAARYGIVEQSKYSVGKNMSGRYVVPLIDGDTYFSVGCYSFDDPDAFVSGVCYGAFSSFEGETWHLGVNDPRSSAIAYTKAAAMPDGRRIFLGGTGRNASREEAMRLWQGVGSDKSWQQDYPPGHRFFQNPNRRDVTCLLPNGKYCGVDEKLGLVVVNPLDGDWYVASADPVFKKGQMGCQLLPNGKVLIVPYDCENELLAKTLNQDRASAATVCGKLYEVDFGFTRSFSVSTLRSPYVRVAECPPEPSGIKVSFRPNGGELPGIYAQYYPQENPTYGTLPTPTRSGYTFLGWGTETNSTTFVKATDPVPSMGIALYAVWAVNTYMVKFNANGGSGTMSNESFTYGTTKALTANAFTRTGYAFQGWATSASGSKVYNDKQSVNNLTSTAGGTVNLYAVWKVSGGVQLWENGPYWAECNVGATKPEEYGYYFWWGDTVGYKRVGSGWNAVDGSRTGFRFISDNCPTFDMNISQLRSAGYVDQTGNLSGAYDAATVHLGAPWRMPTDAEWEKLINKCTTKWTQRNGVYGRLVTGINGFASKSIFIPATGKGRDYIFDGFESGYYWSSTPYDSSSEISLSLDVSRGEFIRSWGRRDDGYPVRAVRDVQK